MMGRHTGAPADSFPGGLNALPTTSENAIPVEGARSKRKQTLLSLLDMLNELSKEGDLGQNQQPSFEDDRDVPTVDEHLQKVGAETFGKFERRILKLDNELRSFANSVRQLGSSVGILSSSYRLRERLLLILHLFRQNAADLFPRKVQRKDRDLVFNPHMRRLRKLNASNHVAVPAVPEDVDVECFPIELEGFANDFIVFLDCLNEFPEFTDENINASVISLEGDLKYWASCLKAYEGQFKYPAVQRYLHDLTAEMGEHLDSIIASLDGFIDIGVPTIRNAQKHAAANLLNLSTVATFFSAVTATTMQFSFDQTGNPLSDSVNGFWFTSLVFSIGAAVNSLLGVTWKQAMYRSPGNRVPWWVLIWIKRSPLVFLVLSVACFSIGLVLFAYSSNQHRVTSLVTTVFSAFSCFGLVAVSCWFASERWIWTRHKGQKWLADAISETKIQVYKLPGIAWCLHEPGNAIRKAKYWTHHKWNNVSDQTAGFKQRVASFMRRIWERVRWRGQRPQLRTDTESSLEVESKSPVVQSYSPEPLSATSLHRPSNALGPIPEGAPSSSGDGDGTTVVSDAGSDAPGYAAGPSTSPAKTRLQHLVRSVIMMNNTAGPSGFHMIASPSRKRTLSSDASGGKSSEKSVLSRSRIAALVPKLREMKIAQDVAVHVALVRHIQFSPDGKFLATSSWDRTSTILSVADSFSVHRVLAHPTGFVSQTAWSPNGKSLLCKTAHGVKIWTEDGVCKKTINRHHPVHSVAWFPEGEAFLSVEPSAVVKLDLNGQVLQSYSLDRINIHDVAVTADSHRMLCVGVLLASSDGLKPKRSRAEKQILVYNFDKKEVEGRVPVLHDVRDITLTRPIAGQEQVALVSYENKAPPQLWKIDVFAKTETARLSLRHTYMPKSPVDFAGPSYFGGKYDQLVLCAGKGGDIHIWDRDSAALLHYFKPQGGGDLTCIAWNPVSDPFMFATGSHDGAVKIWTAKDGALFDEAVSTRSATSVTQPTPRTASPSLFDADYRTDSPAVATEANDTPGPSGSQDYFRRDKAVTFVES